MNNTSYKGWKQVWSKLNCGLINKVSKEVGMSYFQPVFKMVEKGIDEGIFKNEPLELLGYFSFMPIFEIIKGHLNEDFKMGDKEIEAAIKIAWDAISV